MIDMSLLILFPFFTTQHHLHEWMLCNMTIPFYPTTQQISSVPEDEGVITIEYVIGLDFYHLNLHINAKIRMSMCIFSIP